MSDGIGGYGHGEVQRHNADWAESGLGRSDPRGQALPLVPPSPRTMGGDGSILLSGGLADRWG